MIRQYYSSGSPEQALQQPGTLSVISYGAPCAAPASPGLVPIGLNSLCGKQFEVLSAGGSKVERGIDGRCHWSRSDTITLAAIWMTPEQCEDIAQHTYQAYRELLSVLQQSEHPHPFRMWNFLPNINLGEGDAEQYKLFCSGRLRAFTELDIPPERFPAASALGNQDGGAVIYALAGAERGRQHENPNQQRAYRYPRQYGPSSPSFSRATTVELQGDKVLFISGTSSILGHETHSPGDLHAQLKVTLANIQTMLDLVGMDASGLLAIRVYLRHSDHAAFAIDLLTPLFPQASISFTAANICRKNLLVELEATARLSQ